VWRGRDQPRWRWRWAPADGSARAGDAIARVVARYGCAQDIREHRIATRWPEIVGRLVASRTWPDGLDRGALWVEVKSSAWMHQLSFLREEIVRRANEVVGDPPLVREVRFHLGARPGPSEDVLAATARLRRQPAEQRQPPPPAAGERLRAIEGDAAGIADDELRRLIVEVRRRWDR
jgi:hypothetical protein